MRSIIYTDIVMISAADLDSRLKAFLLSMSLCVGNVADKA